MPGLMDILPPEAQALLGAIAILVALVGAVVWGAGIKIARFSVAMLLGFTIASLAAWLLPRLLGVTTITGGLVGFVIGAMAGALGFRVLQGVTLAVCLGIAVAGLYYRWHVADVRTPAVAGETLPASDLLIPTDRLQPGPATAAASLPARQESVKDRASSVVHSLADHWGAIPPAHQKRLLIVGIGTAAVALLIAFGFARQTTWVVSAFLGALMLLIAIPALLHVYGPQYQAYFPAQLRMRYLTLGGLTLGGMILQYALFWPRRPRPAAPAPASTAAPAA